MKKSLSVKRPEIKLVGLTVRTNNQVEMTSWQQGKIFPCVQRYFQQQIFNLIPDRTNPGTTFCAYTDYETDHTGDYTYFIGEEVSSHDNLPEGLEALVIPQQTYAKFTAGPDSMPGVLRNAWEGILCMSDKDFGGARRYHTDFEIYDERASDHNRIILDIFIGIKA